jgi:hypothetical protein
MADNDPKGVLPLYEPEGFQLQVGADGRGRYAAEDARQRPQHITASLSGPTPQYGRQRPSEAGSGQGPLAPITARQERGMGGSRRKSLAERALTPEELLAMAKQMEDDTLAETQAYVDRGPAVQERGLPPAWLRNHMGD